MKVIFDSYHTIKYNNRKQTKNSGRSYNADNRITSPVNNNISFTGIFDYFRKTNSEPQPQSIQEPKPQAAQTEEPIRKPSEPEIVLDEDDKMLLKALKKFESSKRKKYFNKKFNGLKTLKEVEDTIKLIQKKTKIMHLQEYDISVIEKNIEHNLINRFDKVKYDESPQDIEKRFNEFANLLKYPVHSNFKNKLLLKLYFKSMDKDSQLKNIEKLRDINIPHEEICSFLDYCGPDLKDKFSMASEINLPEKPKAPEVVLDEDDNMLIKALEHYDWKSRNAYLNKKFEDLKTFDEMRETTKLILKKLEIITADDSLSYKNSVKEYIEKDFIQRYWRLLNKTEFKSLKDVEETIKLFMKNTERMNLHKMYESTIWSEVEDTYVKTFREVKYNDGKDYIEKRFDELVELLKSPKNNNKENKLLLLVYLKGMDNKSQLNNIEKLFDINMSNGDLNSYLEYFPEAKEKYSEIAFKKIFKDNPDLKDGIYTFDDFSRVTSSRYFRDDMYNKEMNEEGETLIDVFIGILPKNKKEENIQKNIIEKLRSNFRFKTDELGRNYAYKAVEAENIAMIELLTSRYIDNFFKKDKFGVSAIDLVQKSTNPKIKKWFEGKKLYCPEFISAASEGLLLPMKELYKTGMVDINYVSTYNALGYAIKNDHIDVVNYLLSLDNIKLFVDVSPIKNLRDDESVLKFIIDKGKSNVFKECFLKVSGKDLGFDQVFKIDKRECNVYEYIYADSSYSAAKMMEALLQHPDANPNIKSKYYYRPIIFEALNKSYKYRSDIEMIEVLCKSGKLDFSLKNSEGKTVVDLVNEMYDDINKEKLLAAINQGIINNFVTDVKRRVAEDGFLTLTNVSETLNHPSIREFINEKFSDSNETIAHLLADIETDYGNMFEVLKAAKQIININPKLFLEKDIYTQSALERVIFAENTILLEYLIKNLQFTKLEKGKLLQLAHSVGNQDITDLISTAITND